MHKINREVRFSVNPFLSDGGEGCNSYSCRPCGEGLCFYFGLWVELSGKLDPESGFVVNVSDIDRVVRELVVPVFVEKIREKFGKGEHISIGRIGKLLKKSLMILEGQFGQAELSGLELELNPSRKVAIFSEDSSVIYFSEKFEFAASHKLWNDKFSSAKNVEIFGKCANASGHGHNYLIEVSVKRLFDGEELKIGQFERIVDEEFIRLVDHRNLNADVPHFGRVNPTVENIAAFAWDKLCGRFGAVELHCVTVWESERTFCSYYG